MWGTVGGGKTMLMDMFYHTLEGKQSDNCTVYNVHTVWGIVRGETMLMDMFYHTHEGKLGGVKDKVQSQRHLLSYSKRLAIRLAVQYGVLKVGSRTSLLGTVV